MSKLLLRDGSELDDWPYLDMDGTTSVAREVLLRLLDRDALTRMLAAAELTDGQILRLFRAPMRWHALRRLGLRVQELPPEGGVSAVELLGRLQLHERELLHALHCSQSLADVKRRAFGPQPPKYKAPVNTKRGPPKRVKDSA